VLIRQPNAHVVRSGKSFDEPESQRCKKGAASLDVFDWKVDEQLHKRAKK
jgi:hypothetical protein